MDVITDDRARAKKLAGQLRPAVMALSQYTSLPDGGKHFYGQVRKLLPDYEALYPQFKNLEGMFKLEELYPIMCRFFDHLEKDKDHNEDVGKVYKLYGHEAVNYQGRY